MDLPSYNLPQVFSRREQMFQAAMKYAGHIVKGDVYHCLIDCFHQMLPHNVNRETVEKSLKALLGKTWDKTLAFNTAWRLSANLNKLLAGTPVPAFMGQFEAEWMPAQIVGVADEHIHGKFKHKFQFLVLAGSLAGIKIYQSWSVNKMFYLASYRTDKNLGFGFGKPRMNKKGEQLGSLLFYVAEQYFGLRCYLLIEGDKLFQPVIREIAFSSSTFAYNRKLLTKRDRTKTDCKLKLPQNPECYSCPFGVDKCPVAVRPLTLSLITCPSCNAKGYTNPADFDYPGLCIKCVKEFRKLAIL